MKPITGILFFCCIAFVTTAQYNVTTYAGNGNPGFIDGNASGAMFNSPFGICRDKSGNIFVADGGNNCIRKITPGGVVSTYAGIGMAGYLDGAGNVAKFNSPSDLCVDNAGNVYVSDFNNHRIRKISSGGIVSTVAGTGTAGYNDGSAVLAQFNYPRGICIDQQGNLYVGDSWNHRIRKIDNTGNVGTYAGGGNSIGVGSTGDYIDANDTNARFYTPAGLSIDNYGNIYVADAYNHRIRKINTLRTVTTLCGSSATGQGNGGYADGSASSAIFNTPTEVFSDSLGNLVIGDTFGNRVRKADFSGNVTTIAGTGIAGFIDGAGNVAKFNYTRGVTANVTGDTIYLADYNNHSIRMITGGSNGAGEFSLSEMQGITYPNPASTYSTVLLKDTKNSVFRIVDFEGKDVTGNVSIESVTNENNRLLIKLNLEKIAKGGYIIRFGSGFLGRIIKE